MGTALEGGEGAEFVSGSGGLVKQNDQERGASKGVQNLLFRALCIHELI